ncbi:MAG: outer membrane beta-barrel protein [Calditrichae bacterium]|nr:outer membrane beta-barrel protein [candidate division KSB1 bacterium]NIW80402.1 outer membrane beta-barrel protein [Calditrichia bacterium]
MHSNFKESKYSSIALESENFNQVTLGGEVEFHYSPRTYLGIKYDYDNFNYLVQSNVNFDSAINTVFGVFGWRPTPLIELEIFLGFRTQAFRGLPSQNRNDFVYAVLMDYHPTDRTQMRLSVKREIENSSFFAIQTASTISADLDLLQKLGRKWEAEMLFDYKFRDYQLAALDVPGGGVSKVREDHWMQFSFGLTYQVLEWLETKAEYLYRENQSNFDDRDYQNNSANLKFIALFK